MDSPAASVVNMVTRSGTNKFHGSVYDFVRDQIFDANNWFYDHYRTIPSRPLRRNNYGFTIGGPIIKNKTFFFFDYDGLRQTGLSTATAGVPTDLMRTGDFGEVCAAAGRIVRQHRPVQRRRRSDLGSVLRRSTTPMPVGGADAQYFHSL